MDRVRRSHPYKMIFVTVFSVFLISVANGFKNCEDCVSLNECPQAMNLFNDNSNKSRMKLVEAFCSYIPTKIKVCCSDFSSDEIGDIENHTNLHLLPQECGSIFSDRIIGGSITSLNEFPWMVLLAHLKKGKPEFYCGGTLINQRYVLTAAHCMKGHNISFVRVGEYDITKEVDCEGRGSWRTCAPKVQDVPVSHAIIHPNYSLKPVITSDIGLLRLRNLVDFNVDNAGAICLPVFGDLLEKDLVAETGTVAGWGKTETETSNILLKVDVPIHDNEECKFNFGRKKTSEELRRQVQNILCAGELQRDSCQGDSGGPLMVMGDYNENYSYIQYGIISHGRGCGIGIPAIYTDVRKYMKWILDTIKP